MDDLNQRKVINASGKMSILGTSIISDEVVTGMAYGAQNFFVMEEYLEQLEEKIAENMQFPASKIVASAASGLVVAVAASIGKDDFAYYQQPYNTDLPNEIILPKGHNINFGAPIETLVSMGGGKLIEAGFSNECSVQQIEQKINVNTAALMYIVSHHSVQKNMLALESMVKLAKNYNLPIIVDAAAEENLDNYRELLIDLLIISGSKAIEGPNSGIILGEKTAITWADHIDGGIGRAMKVSKEAATGLYVALQSFIKDEDKNNWKKTVLKEKLKQLNNLAGMKAYLTDDPAGRDIQRIAVKSDVNTMKELRKRLEKGDPAVYTRNYLLNQGIIEIDLRSIDENQLERIINKIGGIIDEIRN